MSSPIGSSYISLPETNRSVQISDLDESDIHPDQFRQRSFVRNNFRHHGSFDDHSLKKRSSIMSELSSQIPFIEFYMSYYNAQEY